MVNTAKNVLIMLNNLQQMHLKLLQEECFKKQQRKMAIWLVIKLLIELRKFQKINRMIKKMPKERYISPEGRQEIIDELRLK